MFDFQREDNIILMGSPGAGKTTVGRLLSDRFGMPAVDIDNDFLEKVWNMSVAEKVNQKCNSRDSGKHADDPLATLMDHCSPHLFLISVVCLSENTLPMGKASIFNPIAMH